MLTTALLIGSLIASTHCYGTGAPTRACEDLNPIHAGVQPQTSMPPYLFNVQEVQWAPGQTVLVNIQGDQLFEGELHGFIIQARDAETHRPVGTFLELGISPELKGTCLDEDGKPTAMTHATPAAKGNPRVQWVGPTTGYNGSIYFKGSFADNHDTVWENITSRQLSMFHPDDLHLGDDVVKQSTETLGENTALESSTELEASTAATSEDETTIPTSENGTTVATSDDGTTMETLDVRTTTVNEADKEHENKDNESEDDKSEDKSKDDGEKPTPAINVGPKSKSNDDNNDGVRISLNVMALGLSAITVYFC